MDRVGVFPTEWSKTCTRTESGPGSTARRALLPLSAGRPTRTGEPGTVTLACALASTSAEGPAVGRAMSTITAAGQVTGLAERMFCPAVGSVGTAEGCTYR